MPAPALALLTRELRIDVRRKRSHLLRLAFAGLLFLTLASAEAASAMTGAPGLDFFRSITYFNFGVLTLAGLGYFPTTITEDKDVSTFDLLKLAGIGPLALLLGKSTTRLLTTLLILAVQLPFTLLAVTLGGVLPRQVLAMYASLAAYAMLLANLGLLCSVISRSSAVATGWAAILLGLYFVGIPEVNDAWQAAVQGQAINANSETARLIQSAVSSLRDASIWYRISDVLNARFAGRVWSDHVSISLAAAGMLFGLSWCSLRFVTRTDRGRRLLLGRRRGREQVRRSRRAWSSALLWKELYGSFGGPSAILVRTLAYLVAVVAVGLITLEPPVRRLDRESFHNSVIGLTLILLAAESSVYASLILRAEVESRTLPSLALLPVSIARIACIKVAAAALQLAPVAAALALAAATHPDGPVAAVGVWLPSATGWMILVQFLIFLHATAYFSLVVKWGALPLAFVTVFASSYLFGLCCFLPIAVLATGSPDIGPASRWLGFGIPMIAVATVIIVALQFAIVGRLRTLAAR